MSSLVTGQTNILWTMCGDKMENTLKTREQQTTLVLPVFNQMPRKSMSVITLL